MPSILRKTSSRSVPGRSVGIAKSEFRIPKFEIPVRIRSMAGGKHLLTQILGAPRPAVVISGPAGSGKTTLALDVYRHYAVGGPISGCMFIAPSYPTVEAVRASLLSQAPGGVMLSPRVLTFASLVSAIIAAGNHAAPLLPAYRRQLLLRRIIRQLAAAGKLPVLSAVADTPGLVLAVDRSISELKRGAIEPDALASALARDAKSTPQSGDLLEIYRHYQAELLSKGVYDVEGQAWLVRDLLKSGGPSSALAGLKAVVVDGFTDFTPTQLDILKLLLPGLERMVITIPHDSDGRGRLWQWTQRSIDKLRRALGHRLHEIALGGQAQAPVAGELVARVFNYDASPTGYPANLRLVAASGMDAEVASAARKIKQLLHAEPKARICVVARSLGDYWPVIERVFAEHDIPIAAAGHTLAQSPLARFAMTAAALGPQFKSLDVLKVIKNSYFRPEALGPFTPATVATAEMLIRQANIVGGAEAYPKAVERFMRQLTLGGDLLEDGQEERSVQLGPLLADAGGLADAGRMIQRLIDAWGTLPLPDLIELLDLRTSAMLKGRAELIARDLRDLSTLRATIRHCMDDNAGQAPPLDDLQLALNCVTCPAQRAERVVDVLDALDARGVRYDHVFLVGAGDKQFPTLSGDSCLIGEDERFQWAASGLALDSRNDLLSREMLLFYLAVSRPERSLTISYLESDASGKPAAPSNFLLSFIEPAGGMAAAKAAGCLEQIPPGQFLPADGLVTCRRDAINAGFAAIFSSSSARPPEAGPLAAWPTQVESITRGIFARHRRWNCQAVDCYDGRLTDPALLGHLQERFGQAALGEQVFSASQFNLFGLCPWFYFAQYILHLRALDEPQHQLEAVTRGTFCHNVLFRVMRLLADRCGSPVRLWNIPPQQVLAALEEVISSEAQRVEYRLPPYPALWRIQLEEMRRELARYLLDVQADGAARGEFLCFELGFGIESRPSELSDARSTAAPVEVQTPAGAFRLKGKIDRIDAVDIDDQARLLVVDYKTGRLPTAKDVQQGRNLQVSLYQVAAAKLLGQECCGGVFWRIGGDKGQRCLGVQWDGRYAVDDDYDIAHSLQIVGDYLTSMRHGRFDLTPTAACPSYCPYGMICHFSKARDDIKRPDNQGAPA